MLHQCGFMSSGLSEMFSKIIRNTWQGNKSDEESKECVVPQVNSYVKIFPRWRKVCGTDCQT